MDVTLPSGRVIQGVPEGTPKATIQETAIKNGLATQADFDTAARIAPYNDTIRAAEQQNGIPPGLLDTLIHKESSGHPEAVSKAGALGLTQVLPTTLADMGYDEQQVANDPNLQIQAGAQYLGQMLKATNGNVGRALTAYHSGLGNLQKYESGEKQMGPETAAYASDPRFQRFLQQAAPQDPQAQQNAQTEALAAQVNQPVPQPAPDPTLSQDIEQAGKGLLQAGVNVANIPGSVVNTALDAVGVPKEDQVMTLQLPQNLQPTDPYAKAGAEIGPYLIPVPGVQTESIATAAAKGADALIPRIAQIIERNVPQSVAENTVGALAQNASSGNQNGFGQQIAQDTGASLAVRGAMPVLARTAQAVRESVQGLRQAAPEAQQATTQAADAVPVQTADNAATAAQDTTQAVQQAATPAPAPAATQTVASSEENALRSAALRSATPEADPNLASSLDGLNINPQQDVLDSAARLGVADDLLPSHFSGNAQYRAVEQAIKSRKGSGLKVQEDQAIDKLANRAGQMIDEASQADNSLALSARFNNEYEQRMSALEARSNQLYKRVDDALPQDTQVQAPITGSYLDEVAHNQGGWENLSAPEKAVYKAVRPAGEKLPDGSFADGVLTYARLNRVRKDIGNALGKKQGVYKDEDQQVLGGLYARLSEDQKNILGDAGARRDFEVANRLVQMRKTMESQMQALRGKDLTGDATRKATLAIAGLARGDSAQFRRMFEGNGQAGRKGEAPLVSTRIHRQQLIANAIGDQLSAGKRGTGFNPGGFVDWYENLQRNGGMSLVAKHLPKDFMNQLNDVYKVARGIHKAKAHEVTTGALNDFTARFDRVSKAASLVADNATKAGAAIGGIVGPLGAAAGVAAGAKVAQVAARKGGAEASAAAERLIMSKSYQAQARRLAQATPDNVDAVIASVNAQVKTLPEYQQLIRSLPQAERVKLARLGFIGWVNSSDDQQQGQ